MPEWFSILPPFFAILLSLITRQVVLSLFAGIWLGSFFVYHYNPIVSFLMTLDHYVKPALADPDHAAILIFTMMLGGMAGLITKNGGTAGLVKVVTRFATTAQRGQLVTYLLGILIFFDDYANTLIVGNTMRPITDRLKISREKLSFLVDATSAPVACLFISTWVGFEIGVIRDSLQGTGFAQDPFSIFLWSIPYRFYPIFTIILMGIMIALNRDIGGMAKAEIRARTTGKLLRDGAEPASDLTESKEIAVAPHIPKRWYNACIPVGAVIVITLIGLYITGLNTLTQQGGERTLRNILANSSSSDALFWSSLSGCAIAILLSIGQRILTLKEAMEAWFGGIRSMLLACLILLLAWSLAGVTQELKTADFVVGALTGKISYGWLPFLIFLLSCLISFATGTSWGTMAVVMPLTTPLAWAMAQSAGLNPVDAQNFLYSAVSSVLAGAVFGDHCSPISDTTVMSSMTSGCDHIDHVRTQMPYAVLAGVISMIALISAGHGASPYLLVGIGSMALFMILRFFGKKVNHS
ncbi:MAG: Na+/H+ antiporter NhaC family protein [Deltaproteobacteria bacterium]|nr:Na+/H+ antiporter NhaC family protein [Deltaproteobacteria bacterium]